MKGYVDNIEKLALENENFREVLYTDKKSQLVLMSLRPEEEIGEEVHDVDQFLRVEKGVGKAVLNGISREIGDGSAILVPVGTRHNIATAWCTKRKRRRKPTPSTGAARRRSRFYVDQDCRICFSVASR